MYKQLKINHGKQNSDFINYIVPTSSERRSYKFEYTFLQTIFV